MADASFYGGQPGFSCVIVANYDSVDDMITYFKKGPSYDAVHFNEYVLINTPNRRDEDHGSIYRRGYDYTNDMGGAIYVGTIVGPMGVTPMVELTTIAEIKAIEETDDNEYRYSEGSYAPTENLIAGKDSGGNYNDEIQWACCSIRTSDGDATAYIGFIVPYLVAEFTAQSVNAYYNRSNSTSSFTNLNLITRTDDESHPFYEAWKISVPKGIKGDTGKNFRVITATSSVSSYTGQTDDVNNSRQILVYDYYNYDTSSSGTVSTIYLGDYNMIDSIDLSDEGTLTIDYSHDDSDVYTKLFKWIDSIVLDTDTGHLTVTYNYDTDSNGNSTKYETDLTWINDVVLSSNGKLTFYYTTGESKTLTNTIRWISNVTLADNGTITVNYNDGTSASFNQKIKWITSVSLTNKGLFTISFNNGESDYTTTLTWVKDITIDNDGTVAIVNNTGEKTVYDNLIKVISNVTIETDNGGGEGSGDQKVHITYNTGEEDIIGEPLNYIMEMALDKESYHLLARYSDPERRAEIVENHKNFVYNEIEDWYDLGAVKDYSGILVGMNLTGYDGSDVVSIIEILNTLYSEGLTDEYMEGKVITIGDALDNKYFYAYDYEKGSWYYLGNFNVDLSNVFMVAGEYDSDLEDKQTALRVGGIWFVTEDD